jgi:predicted metalloenzyme YecM
MNADFSKNITTMFRIKTFDHVALRVRDLETSAQWYERIK